MSKLLENLLDEPERGTLVYLSVDRINPHPDNPRKDLGDLTELADSIKQNGILQNLTVVPYFSPVHKRVMAGAYTVIIGHRRLAAAKMAGLTEVPCVIVEMDYRDQLQTMLQENIQRSDLTVYEQARGFQMMLDLGETVETLAEKSGFSQSTIRRRVKLLDLDEKAFKASVERGATLADYAELDKIEDPDRKNKVLAAIGTADFRNVLKTELAAEKRKRAEAKWREKLSAFATEVDATYQYHTVKCWSYVDDADALERPEEEGPYYFHISSWGSVYLLADKPKLPAETEEQRLRREAQAREDARQAGLTEASERAYELRAEFANDANTQTAVRVHWGEIVATWMCLCSMYGAGTGTVASAEILENAFSLKREEYGDSRTWLKYEDCLAAVGDRSAQMLWRMVWLSFGDSRHNLYVDWQGTHKTNKPLDVLYNLLTVLGYEMCDEEKQLQDGTHPLFQKEGAE